MYSLGSCVLHLHVESKAFTTIFEVTNMTGLIILGRAQAKAMGYIKFPKSSAHILSPCTPLLQKRFAQSRHKHQRLQLTFHPQTQWVPHPEYMYTKNESTKATQVKQSRQTTEPVVP